MCGIAGFCNPYQDLETEAFKWSSTLERMNHVQKHRGPNEDGTLLTKHTVVWHKFVFQLLT